LDPTALGQIEKIVHPLVGQDRARFLAQTTADIAVLDRPLLYDTGGEARMEAVACVLVSEEVQKQRVLARGTMTSEQFQAIREKQLPAKEKAGRADYVITTDTLEHARAQVQNVVADIRKKIADA
jgi:dephospho-CoA kinase